MGRRGYFQEQSFYPGRELKLKGKIEDIAPGERIYSVRFMGKKGMVTFHALDPLLSLIWKTRSPAFWEL